MKMNKIYGEIAKKYGLTAAQVRRDMQRAVEYAYHNPANDEMTKACQRQVPCRNDIPTVAECIRYAAKSVNGN